MRVCQQAKTNFFKHLHLLTPTIDWQPIGIADEQRHLQWWTKILHHPKLSEKFSFSFWYEQMVGFSGSALANRTLERLAGQEEGPMTNHRVNFVMISGELFAHVFQKKVNNSSGQRSVDVSKSVNKPRPAPSSRYTHNRPRADNSPRNSKIWAQSRDHLATSMRV